MQGKRGEAELYLDYKMSEKFGLDWCKYEYSKINSFREILLHELSSKKKSNNI